MSNISQLLESLISQASQEKKTNHVIHNCDASVWWLEQYPKLPDSHSLSMQLTNLSFLAPNFSCTFIAAYQIALRIMFPEYIYGQNIACLCISEKGRNSPKAIHCTLENGVINGEKSFVTCAQNIQTLLVMLDDKETITSDNTITSDKKNLKLAIVTNTQEIMAQKLGLTITLSEPAKFLPEIGKGRLSLNNFPLANAQLIIGDAHDKFSKPFSVIEGLCIRFATCTTLLKWACILNWSEHLKSDLIIQILSLKSCIDDAPLSPITQITIDSQSRAMENIIEQVDSLVTKEDPKLQEHWQRDKVCFYMDFRLRPSRLEKAWVALS
jgi:hypothetical protein